MNGRARSRQARICALLVESGVCAELHTRVEYNREVNRRCLHLSGGVLASTEVRARGMHAERHRLVNPVETNVTANTQLALAA
jgi:hypothetical protein